MVAPVATRELAEARADPVEREVIHAWHDPPGLWGFLVTVQNGPIFNRLGITIFVFFLLVAAGISAPSPTGQNVSGMYAGRAERPGGV